MKNIEKGSDATILRQKAEEQLRKKRVQTVEKLSEVEMLNLVHELEVHQIELELQNEELMTVKEQAETEAYKYAALFDFAPSGYLTLSKAGIVTELNYAASQMLAKDRMQLKNARFGFFVSDDTRSIYDVFFDRIFVTAIKESCDVTLTINGNQPLYVHLTGIVSENGNQCYIVAVDITERKKTEEIIRESIERFRSITQSASDAMISSNSRGIITDWNRSAEILFGYTEKEIIGKRLSVIIPERFVELHERGMKRVEQGGEHRVIGKTVEVVGLHKSGNEIPTELSLSEWQTASEKHFTAIIRDITDRKKLDENLIKNETMYRTLIENTGTGYLIIDSHGMVIDANKEYVRLSGHKELREILGKSVLEWTAEYEREKNAEAVAQCARDGFIKNMEIDYVDTAGRITPVEISATVDGKGEEIRILSICRDINVRKRAEGILKFSEKKYRSLVETAQELVWKCDENGCFTYLNPAWEHTHGYTVEEMLGKNFGSFQKPEIFARDKNEFSRHLAGGSVKGYETTQIAKDGRELTLLFNAIPLFNIDGILIGTQGTATDITERKHAEEALGVSEYQYHRLIETMADGVYKSSHEGKFIEVNPAMVKILGYDSKEELLEIDIKTQLYFDADDRDSLSTEEELSGRSAFRLRKKDGSEVWVEDQGRLILDGDKNILFHEGVLRDITERKNTEQSLRQAQKLESIGTLAGGIAHDFNNLMNAVLGQAGLALQKLPKENPAVDHITKAIKASERVADLTKQLLAYSGRGKFVIEEIDLNIMVKENIQLLEVSLPKMAILRYELGTPSLYFKGDISQIQQVIMNLIINAGEAMDPNPGYITVHTSRIEIKTETNEYSKYTGVPLAAGSYAVLQVKDTGSGISEETLKRIFDPFFTTKFTGRGLGLAAVLGIIKGHKGGLRINSEVGKGTTFEIVFPLIDPSKTTEVSVKDDLSVINGEGKTILVIDDESTVIELLEDILTEVNFSVISAIDPLHGIELYRREHQNICMVILDYSMPSMDGKAAFEELIKINNDAKVLLCSGYSEEAILSVFGIDRPAGYFQKPYKTEALVQSVAEIVSKEK